MASMPKPEKATVAELAAANKLPPWWDLLTYEQQQHLLGLNAPTAYCKGRRRHTYKPLIPGEPIPRSVHITVTEGITQVTEHCLTCARWVRRLADPRGVIDYSTQPQYGGGQAGYIAKGLDMPAWAYSQWIAWLQAEQIREGVALAKAKATAERQKTEQEIERRRGKV